MIKNIKDIHNWLITSGVKFGDSSKVDLSLSLIDEELLEIKDAIKENNREEVLDGIADLFVVLHNLSLACAITPEEIEHYQQIVSVSNWSKFAKTEEEAKESVALYVSGTHPDKYGTVMDAYYEKVGHYYIIKRRDNKILKSHKYFKVKDLIKQ